MAYAQLKTDIAAVIRNNGNQEITGNVLQGALLEMINALGANYQYAGVADTSTTITTTEANVFYLLTAAGTYSNMSSSIVHASGIGIALWNGTAWSYQNVPSSAIADFEQLNNTQYLTDATIVVKQGYISGANGSAYVINQSTSRHYCILPANIGATPRTENCTPYNRININESGNVISTQTYTTEIPSSTTFVAFNFEDSANTYENAKILQSLSLAEQNRFDSQDYNCFVRYSTYKDVEYYTSNSKPYAQFFRSIISIKLNGFNKENPHHLYNLTRNYGSTHKYGIIIREYANGSWTIVFNSSKTNVETNGVANGVNVVTWTSGTKSVTATIDYSLITENLDVNLAVPTYIFKAQCFEDISSLETQIGTINSTALFKSMLSYSIVSDNIANPANIVDGKFISSAGSVATDANWSLIKIPVSAGQEITFGGFYLGRGGYYRFEDANGDKVSNGSYSDPNGRQTPVTVTVPTNAVLLYFDIKTGSSPSTPYAELMVNIGSTLLPYDQYATAISGIDGENIVGGASKDLENRVEDLEGEVSTIQDEIGEGIGMIIADLPVSDGTGISVGYAYIDSSTGVVKVKMS